MPATVSSPSKFRNSWLRTTAPPAVKVKVLKRARAPIAAASVETWSASAPSPMILTWSTCASSPTNNLERGVDLIVAAGRAFVALDQHGAGALFDHHQRAHEGRRRLCRGDEEQMDRPLDGRARGDADHGAVAHQRGIERDRDVACRRELAEMSASARDRHRRARRPANSPTSPGSNAAMSDSSATNAPSTKTRRRVSTSPISAPADLASALPSASGGAASGLASRISARRSVYFHSSIAAMRQALARENVKSRRALRRDRLAARKPRARLREFPR